MYARASRRLDRGWEIETRRPQGGKNTSVTTEVHRFPYGSRCAGSVVARRAAAEPVQHPPFAPEPALHRAHRALVHGRLCGRIPSHPCNPCNPWLEFPISAGDRRLQQFADMMHRGVEAGSNHISQNRIGGRR